MSDLIDKKADKRLPVFSFVRVLIDKRADMRLTRSILSQRLDKTLQRLDKTLAASYRRYEAATQRLMKTLTQRSIAAS